jgi:hypothetical protein
VEEGYLETHDTVPLEIRRSKGEMPITDQANISFGADRSRDIPPFMFA